MPIELDDIRAEVQASYGWRRDGQAVSAARYEQLPDNQRSDCRWQPDPAVVARLMVAEAAETTRHVGWVEAEGRTGVEAGRTDSSH